MTAAVARIETGHTADLRAKVDAEIQRRGVTQAQAAREMGIDKGALNQWLRGRYAGNNDKIAEAAATWLDGVEPEQTSAHRPLSEKPSGYIATPTGKAIFQHLQWAHERKVLVVIYGDAGVGKSMACAQYAADHPAVWATTLRACHVTITSTINSPRALLRRLAFEIGFREHEVPREAALLHDRVIECLRGSGGLLILDEAQHLQPKELEVVRGIYDAAGIGVALVGNEYSYSRFNRGRREQYSQLVSRFDLTLHLEGVCDGDVESIATDWGVTDKRTLERLGDVAGRRGAGALRRVHKVLNLAHEFAATAGTAINRKHVERAAEKYA